MLSQFFLAAASVALVGAGASGIADVRSFNATPMSQTSFADGDGVGSADGCQVDVVRSGQPGTVTSTRTNLKNGGCVCVLVTGPASSNGNAEGVIADMVRERTCPESPTVGGAVSEAASGGHSGVIVPVLIGVAGAVGLAVALGSSSNG